MYRYLMLILGFFLISCVNQEPPKIENQVNALMEVEAKNIFGDVLKNEKSYFTYSAYMVIYEIDIKDYSLESIKNIKYNWKFKKKVGESYVFCKDKMQLELVPPRKITENKELNGGEIAAQLEDQWNILFYQKRNRRPITCDS